MAILLMQEQRAGASSQGAPAIGGRGGRIGPIGTQSQLRPDLGQENVALRNRVSRRAFSRACGRSRDARYWMFIDFTSHALFVQYVQVDPISTPLPVAEVSPLRCQFSQARSIFVKSPPRVENRSPPCPSALLNSMMGIPIAARLV